MFHSQKFYAAADGIAYDFHTKLWRFVNEFRATNALLIPRTSNNLYWYETDAGTRISQSLPIPYNSVFFADEFGDRTVSKTLSPSRSLPNLEKYRRFSHCLWPAPMVIEVVLKLPQLNAATTGSPGLISPDSIILEIWKLSLAWGQNDDLMESSPIHQLTRMYEERRRFFWHIRICLGKLPAAKFARQVQISQACHSPSGHGMGPEILVRFSSGPADAIKKQFVLSGKLYIGSSH